MKLTPSVALMSGFVLLLIIGLSLAVADRLGDESESVVSPKSVLESIDAVVSVEVRRVGVDVLVINDKDNARQLLAEFVSYINFGSGVQRTKVEGDVLGGISVRSKKGFLEFVVVKTGVYWVGVDGIMFVDADMNELVLFLEAIT